METERARTAGPSRLLRALDSTKTVYFCGLSKNAGKTVALRQAMDDARRSGRRIAVTSIGRDGEAYDAIHGDFAKPRLHFCPEELVVTSERLLPADASCEVVHHFGITTPVGPVVGARILSSCSMELAGPSTVSALRIVQSWIMESDVDLFLIDGALDRKAASLPDVCDGVVLSSGAALSDHMDEVISQTRAAVDMLRIGPETVDESDPRVVFSPVFDAEDRLREAFSGSGSRSVTIEVRGAVTDRLVEYLRQRNLLRRTHIVADCFAKIFINRQRWSEYRRFGLRISCRRSIPVLALTVNPVSPHGKQFEPAGFLNSMRLAVPEIPVFDVISELYRVDESGLAGPAGREATVTP